MLNECTATPCIPTRDIATARRFYEEVLGLEAIRDDMGGVMYAVGSGGLFLYESEYAGLARHTLVNLESDHIDDDIAELREKGVRFETYDDLDGVTFSDGVADMDGIHGVWFKDPDQNTLGLFQTVDVPAGVG